MSGQMKSRYWWGVGYPESMAPDWQENIEEDIPLPFAYGVHDKDVDSESDERKDHVHLIVVFPNTTTYKHALEVMNLLSADGKTAFNTVKPILNIRHAYNYLTHDTDTCRKKGKYLYYEDGCRPTTGNNFDIGSYEQMSLDEKRAVKEKIADYVIECGFEDIVIAYQQVQANFEREEFSIFLDNIAMFDRLTAGNYKQNERKRAAEERARAREKEDALYQSMRA